MDDKTFDLNTAETWIAAIEKQGKTLRDDDIYPRLNVWRETFGLKHVLDLGCGQGICATKLKGYETYEGVEPSPFMVARAKELYQAENITFTEGSAYNLPQWDEKFDGVFSVLVFHLLEDLDLAVAHLARVLKPGGHFCIITTNPDAMMAWAEMYDNCEIKGVRLHGTMELNGLPSEDTLYFHDVLEFQNSLKAFGLHMHGYETFRKGRDEDQTDMLMFLSGVKTATAV